MAVIQDSSGRILTREIDLSNLSERVFLSRLTLEILAEEGGYRYRIQPTGEVSAEVFRTGKQAKDIGMAKVKEMLQ